eukprot:4617325-Alexandrium_andersonii.AAC.1
MCWPPPSRRVIVAIRERSCATARGVCKTLAIPRSSMWATTASTRERAEHRPQAGASGQCHA